MRGVGLLHKLWGGLCRFCAYLARFVRVLGRRRWDNFGVKIGYFFVKM